MSRDWAHSGPMGSEHWRGVLREEEVRLHVGGGGGMGILAAEPDVSTLCVGARMDKRQNVSVRE